MATLEELSAALVKADAAGNTADAKAFADAIRQMRAAPVSTIDQIPGARRVYQQPVEKPGILGSTVGGLIETPMAIGANLISGPVTYLAGALGPDVQRKVAEEITYQPRTQMAQSALEAVGRGLEATKLPPYMGPIAGGNMLAESLGPAARAIADVGRSEGNLVKGAISAPIEARAAAKQAQLVAKSYENAPIIDAAQAANRQGFVVNPAITNPTKRNVIRGMVVGPAFDEGAVKQNAERAVEVVRNDLGATPTEKLTPDIVERALDQESKPYDVIRKMDSLEAPPEAVDALKSLRKEAPIGGDVKTSAINALVDDALTKLQKTTTGPFTGVGGAPVKVGRSGAMILDDIRSMRRDAQATYKAQAVNPDPLAIAKADTQMSIASILEDIVDANAPSPKALADMRAARTRMAQIYDHDRAINYANQTVDPQVYAKLLDERKGNMTGVGADIGIAAATFPDLMQPQAPAAKMLPKATRSGVGSAIGALAGGQLGGYPGAIGGAAVGGAGSWAAQRAMAKNMLTPEFQATRAMPIDYRPPANMLRPVEPGVPQNALVPYDWSQQIITRDQIPNWAYAPNDIPPRVTPTGVPSGPAQITMSQGPVGGQMGALRAEDVRLYQQQAAADAQAAAAAEQRATATRQPASGGVQFDLDPITGKLVPTSSTLKGDTPNVQVAESTGHSMSTAADKVASGKLFDMTPEERIAWNRTKVDLAEADPGLKGLSDKAVASKMMDRQWIADTITKLREQDAAFNMLAQRSATNRAASDAANAAALRRAQLMDQLIALEDSLRPARPTSTGGQGPKTRAAKNRLIVNPINELAQ